MSRFAEFDKITDADVLVVGGGLAGAFAAIKAKEAGAEKMLSMSLQIGTGGFCCPSEDVERDGQGAVPSILASQNCGMRKVLIGRVSGNFLGSSLERRRWGMG